MEPLSARRKYNLLYVVGPSIGGIKTHVKSLVMGMDKQRFNIHVMAPSNLVQELKETKGIECHEFRIDNISKIPILVDNILKVFKYINSQNIELAHFHGFKASIIGCLASMMPKCKTKTIATIHNFVGDETVGIIYRLAFRVGARIIIKNADVCITVSNALARAIGSINKSMGTRVHVIYNGIDTAGFRPVSDTNFYRRSVGYHKDHILIGSVCRLVRNKGLDFLVEGIALLKQRGINTLLLIAGDGPYKEALMNFCKDLNIWDNVRFLGYIYNIQDFYNALDIFVLPTLAEGLGISVLEAMAMAKPVIATMVGGVPEIITNRYNGILVRPGDSKAIADALMHYINNPRDKTVHGTHGRDTVKKKFTCGNMIKQTQDIYLQVLKELG